VGGGLVHDLPDAVEPEQRVKVNPRVRQIRGIVESEEDTGDIPACCTDIMRPKRFALGGVAHSSKQSVRRCLWRVPSASVKNIQAFS
jgi:hypothetical protein